MFVSNVSPIDKYTIHLSLQVLFHKFFLDYLKTLVNPLIQNKKENLYLIVLRLKRKIDYILLNHFLYLLVYIKKFHIKLMMQTLLVDILNHFLNQEDCSNT